MGWDIKRCLPAVIARHHTMRMGNAIVMGSAATKRQVKKLAAIVVELRIMSVQNAEEHSNLFN